MVPVWRPASASSSCSAAPRVESACAARAARGRPASVSRLPRPFRSTSRWPAAASRRRRCWLALGCPIPIAAAAAETLPRRSISTSRRIRVVSQSSRNVLVAAIPATDSSYRQLRLARSRHVAYARGVILRPFLYPETACASYLFGCLTASRLAVVELGNTRVRAFATPGHAPAHNAYVVSDLRRGTDDPWLVFTGDSLLVGDVGRPDLHAGVDPLPLARQLHASLGRLLELPDGVSVYPSHYGGSVCGRGLSGNPFSTIGFERRHNPALAAEDAEAFARALLVDVPPPPADQAAIVAANRRGALPVRP